MKLSLAINFVKTSVRRLWQNNNVYSICMSAHIFLTLVKDLRVELELKLHAVIHLILAIWFTQQNVVCWEYSFEIQQALRYHNGGYQATTDKM